MKNMKTSLGERLRELRGNSSQDSVAKLFGVKQPSYSSWETGRKEPSLGTLVAIAEHFGVSTDWLLGVAPAKARPAPAVPSEAASEISAMRALVASQQRTIEMLARAIAPRGDVAPAAPAGSSAAEA